MFWSVLKFFLTLRFFISAAKSLRRDAYVLGVKLGLVTKR